MSVSPGRRRQKLFEIHGSCCNACAMCLRVCAEDAVERDGDVYRIVRQRCNGCEACVRVCPTGCIHEVERP